jgi:RimJ/RimL family protein N-acetyltransferase
LTLDLRPITGPDELDLFNRLPYGFNAELADDLDSGRRRPSWLWVALRDGRLVARAAWWSRPGDARPLLLDVFDIAGSADLDDGIRLVRTALDEIGPPYPEYTRFVPADWREDEQSRVVVEDRMTALARLGAKPLVERLRLEWLPGTPIPRPVRRLAFRPVRGDEELLDLMADVLTGTLDAHSRDDLTRMTPAAAARLNFDDEFAKFTSPRDWWRIATLPDGEPVGFVIAAHNGYNPVIAYLAVRPVHRGHGYIDEILAEGTRILAGQDVPRIRAATDTGNVPMANAFARAGYATIERQITMTWQ